MISQEYIQGKNKIRIDSAESIEDAKRNMFNDGEYSRYFVNNKIVTYGTLMNTIIAEAKENKNSVIKNEQELLKSRNEMLNNQTKVMKDSIRDLKQHYKTLNVPQNIFDEIDKFYDKIDLSGVRNVK
jgi:hypothetical protein